MKYRQIRRSDKAMPEDAVKNLLQTGEYGILSTYSEEGPYGVPLSYIYQNDSIYFHCFIKGHKLNNLEQCSKVCFTIVANTKLSTVDYVTNFESVMAFGKAQILEEGDEKKEVLTKIVEKYTPMLMDGLDDYIEQYKNTTTVVKIPIDEISGKWRKGE